MQISLFLKVFVVMLKLRAHLPHRQHFEFMASKCKHAHCRKFFVTPRDLLMQVMKHQERWMYKERVKDETGSDLYIYIYFFILTFYFMMTHIKTQARKYLN